MTYQITFTDGNVYTTLGPGVVDSKLGLSLIGPSTQNYGQLIANNFVRLLENQANDTAPTFPIAGQMWWNTGAKVLSYFDGNKFKPCSSSELGPTPPLSPLDGDQWWDTTNNQLNVWNGVIWELVGPGYIKGQGVSGLYNTVVSDNSSQQHVVSQLQLNGNVVAIISNENSNFTLASNVSGISTVQPGINLITTAVLNGTAVNSQMLSNSTWGAPGVIGNITPKGGTFTTLAATSAAIGNMSLSGGIISSSSILHIGAGNASITTDNTNGTITVSNDPVLSNSVVTKNYADVQDDVHLAMANAYTDANVAMLLGAVSNASIKTIGGLSSAIGNDPSFSTNIYAQKADKVNPTFSGATVSLSSGTSIIPAANVTSDLGSVAFNFRNIYAQTTYSTLADLAERYDSDAEYEVGTVVVFGGDKEITVSAEYCDSRVAGVVSEKPAHIMNNTSDGVAIALTGKVPCKVIGPVKKGDVMVNSSSPGVATAFSSPGKWVPGCTIGKSLQNDSNTGLRIIMISVGRF